MIKVGIVGYGNLGRGVEKNIKNFKDFELVGVFSRRDGVKTDSGVASFKMSELENFKGKIDVLILCGGSANDLREQSPAIVKNFNIVDSFDNHAFINDHYKEVDASAKSGGKIAIISVGWDPGLFSLNRIIGSAVLPNSKTYTFWGKGVSQGHSDAIRRIKGVKDARQYTIPSKTALDTVRSGDLKEFSTKEKHTRECFVVLENDTADERKRVEHEIKTMPNYFEPYDTTVNFISEDELLRDHAGLPHGGVVITSGITGKNCKQIYEFSLNLDSNPEFTSSVMIAYARAAYRLSKNGESGARTIAQIAPYLISDMSLEDMRVKGMI
ncbi:diaminopimelate dehydrogenase [Campylobacter corcagiensis]|uniref:Meso-diaminopimelate D-dehydrogenase n=1 Tax=Campylobacter corcagiensis TaxID=1448857 RepID=A0A7M1LJW2_9BACT|nr:diaminopimelate dehydrogenase [Campylobacter corcagiensis]QKF65322.1 meso-diaminopimelate D-dehydrogenase [Campylobacter corcagiensis]QOQ88096.1 diaminopimelate dehydrogenase [Campylobacter corcagiensis]